MLEPSLTHIGGAKLLGGALMPASLLVLGGVVVWQLWQSKKAIRQLEANLTPQQQEQQALSQQLDELKEQVQTLLMPRVVAVDAVGAVAGLGEIDKVKDVKDVKDVNYVNSGDSPTDSSANSVLSSESNLSKEAVNPSKLAMLKRLLEDNLNLRKHFN